LGAGLLEAGRLGQFLLLQLHWMRPGPRLGLTPDDVLGGASAHLWALDLLEHGVGHAVKQ
jgi:hypothetical protein